jgi:hypothetical protein
MLIFSSFLILIYLTSLLIFSFFFIFVHLSCIIIRFTLLVLESFFYKPFLFYSFRFSSFVLYYLFIYILLLRCTANDLFLFDLKIISFTRFSPSTLNISTLFFFYYLIFAPRKFLFFLYCCHFCPITLFELSCTLLCSSA